jgi:hypothetical protein
MVHLTHKMAKNDTKMATQPQNDTKMDQKWYKMT